MKHTKFSVRRAALLLAVAFSLIISACILAVEVGAKDLNSETDEDTGNFSWKLDFEKMSSLTDNQGSSEYSLQTSSTSIVKKVNFDGKTALNITDNKGYYYIVDTNNALHTYDTFYIECDMYFEKYPSGSSGTETPKNYPMSFLTWMTKETDSGNTSYRSIRINYEGYLCTGSSPETNPEQITDVKIPLKEWFTIKFAISPQNGYSEVFIDGESVLVYSIGSPKTTVSSIIRFFDNRYSYSVYLSDISVCSDANLLIGLVEEPTVNYLAYQTTEIDTVDGKQCFDLRLISGIDSLEYSSVGYDITVVQEIDGVVQEKRVNLSATSVYDSILADHIRVDASEYGAKYLVAMAINDIRVDADYIEIVVMPYAVKNGMRIFGNSVFLSWRGATKNGYPVFSYSDSLESYSTVAVEDTHTRAGTNTSANYGSNTLVELKNNGTTSGTTRHAYFKFDFNTDIAKERLKTSSKIYFDFFIKSMRPATTAEAALGGVEVKVYGVGNNWSESTLTHTSAKNLSSTLITSARLQGTETYCRVDVTDYVLAHINDGQVSFKLVNVVDDGSNGQTSIYSSESSSNPPMLTTYTSRINHEINLPKLLNYGYEPWGYAEKLVNEWIETDRDLLYSPAPRDTIDLSAVNISKSSGAYSNSFVKYSNNPTSTSSSTVYVRNLASLKKNGYSTTSISQYDKYGGITNSGIKGQATGYFHLETFGDRQYIIDPIGNPFFSIGINTAQLGANQNQKDAALEKYGTTANFYSSVVDEMRSVGINTYWGGDEAFFGTGKICRAVGIGCMSEYMKKCGLSISTGGSAKYLHNNTMNVFDPDFIAHCQERADTIVPKYLTGSLSQYKDFILGFYSDNEIPSQKDMLYCYLTIDPSAAVNAFSYATAWTYLERMTGKVNPSIDDITPELSEEFKAFVYNAYFKAVTNALESVGAGNYMYLGNRIHSTNMTSEGYLRAAAQYMDIISANLYGGVEPPIETIKTMYKYSGKPFIVTEFFSKANDAVDMNGYTLGNQANAGLIVKTQADRALMYENYTLLLLESQTCVGWTWYRFRDNDQTIYQDASGNKYRAFDYQNGAISAYVNVDTGAKVSLSNMPTVSVFYKGESDTSNLGSNKGIYDNRMNMYTTLTSSMKLITDNIFGLVNYFDKIH